MIIIRAVTKRYGAVTALQSVDPVVVFPAAAWANFSTKDITA